MTCPASPAGKRLTDPCFPPLLPACAVFSACVVPSCTSSPPRTHSYYLRSKPAVPKGPDERGRVSPRPCGHHFRCPPSLRVSAARAILLAPESRPFALLAVRPAGVQRDGLRSGLRPPPRRHGEGPRARLPASIASRTAPAVALALFSYATCRSPLTLVLSNLDTMCLGARLPHSGLLPGASLPRSPQTLGSSSSSHGPFWVLCGPGALRSPRNLWVQDAGRS